MNLPVSPAEPRPPRVLGLDFDNTLVCYDRLFHQLAFERGLIPAGIPGNKSDVRNYLRQSGREDDWTELQGIAYGSRILEAEPYPGAVAFCRAARAAGWSLRIISHKTPQPYRGAPCDLHAAARRWLEAQGFFAREGGGLDQGAVFLEETKAAKLKRIAACGCLAFVDDLPEFLAEPAFPPGVERWLFDPHGLYEGESRFPRVASWDQLRQQFCPATSPPAPNRPATGAPVLDPALHVFLDKNGFSARSSLVALVGGANNRVSHVVDQDREGVLKVYFHNPADPRDRFRAERAFYELCHRTEVRRTPEPLAWDEELQAGLLSFVRGRKLRVDEVNADCVDQALALVAQVNRLRSPTLTAVVPVASEACFSAAEHLATVGRRVDRLATAAGEETADPAFRGFVRERLIPFWHRLSATMTASAARTAGSLGQPLPVEQRCLSPSDFGFHNALLPEDGRLRFFDFEYAGWDDPAKLVCDFFCQPQLPAPPALLPRFVRSVAEIVGDPGLDARVRWLHPAYQLKWCCILLNEYVPSGQARRQFSSGREVDAERRAAQLAKARMALARAEELAGG